MITCVFELSRKAWYFECAYENDALKEIKKGNFKNLQNLCIAGNRFNKKIQLLFYLNAISNNWKCCLYFRATFAIENYLYCPR
jgi:hypothetical protein